MRNKKTSVKQTKPRMSHEDRCDLSNIVENLTRPSNIDNLRKRIKEMNKTEALIKAFQEA